METNRRNFLMAVGAGAAVGAGVVLKAHAEETTGFPDVEAANTQMVNDFCAAWESMDLEKIYENFSDDVVFHMTESTRRLSVRRR
jgi:hypothetical protein